MEEYLQKVSGARYAAKQGPKNGGRRTAGEFGQKSRFQDNLLEGLDRGTRAVKRAVRGYGKAL